MSFEGRNYFAQHVGAPQNLQGTPMFNVEVSEGNTPPGDFFPAAYLPALVSENRISNSVGSWYVIMPGKVLTIDTNKRLVPAGFILDKALNAGSRTIKYTSKDVEAGTVKATGAYAVEGDEVVTDLLAAGIDLPADPIGYACYAGLQSPGSDPLDPSTFYRHAYDTGGAIAFKRNWYIQVPVVEVNKRVEAIQDGSNTHRIALYTDGSALVFKKGATTLNLTQKANANLLTQAATATEFALIGRTVMMNAAASGTDWTVTYQPKIDLPFACLKVDYGQDITTANAKGIKDYLMKQVGFNSSSDYQIIGTDGCSAHKIGRILDVKEGSSEQLKLVRTYFRDFGLWQEAPGSATDGRNAILSIANAPKYIARIKVNFDAPVFA